MSYFPVTAEAGLLGLRTQLIPLLQPLVGDQRGIQVFLPLDGSRAADPNRATALSGWLTRELAKGTNGYGGHLDLFLTADLPPTSPGIPDPKTLSDCMPYVHWCIGNMPPIRQAALGVCFDPQIDLQDLDLLFRRRVVQGGYVLLYGEFPPFSGRDPRPEFVDRHALAWQGHLRQIGQARELPLLALPIGHTAATAIFQRQRDLNKVRP